MMRFSITCLISIVTLAHLSVTSFANPVPEKLIWDHDKSWRENVGWRAEDYFEDEKVIELCHAIETDNLDKMKSLISDGVNVNARGKDNMTPLVWSFPGRKFERFKLLLENGADPNVRIKSDLGMKYVFQKDSAIIHMAIVLQPDSRYCDAVFEYGGDVNLPYRNNWKALELVLFHKPSVKRVRRLIALGADVNNIDSMEWTPAKRAVVKGQFESALVILRATDDPVLFPPDTQYGITHIMYKALKGQEQHVTWSEEDKYHFEKLRKHVESYGVTIEDAKADYERWNEWYEKYPLPKVQQMREKERMQRNQRLKEEKAKSAKE